MNSVDLDQTVQMHRLIWIYIVHLSQLAPFRMDRLIINHLFTTYRRILTHLQQTTFSICHIMLATGLNIYTLMYTIHTYICVFIIPFFNVTFCRYVLCGKRYTAKNISYAVNKYFITPLNNISCSFIAFWQDFIILIPVIY